VFGVWVSAYKIANQEFPLERFGEGFLGKVFESLTRPHRKKMQV
jgi:hypothetical protein